LLKTAALKVASKHRRNPKFMVNLRQSGESDDSNKRSPMITQSDHLMLLFVRLLSACHKLQAPRTANYDSAQGLLLWALPAI
jgi:hypothetical protein